MDIRKRLKNTLLHFDCSINSIASDGAMQTRLSRQINGGAAITYDTLSRFLDLFPNVSAEWLMRGEGDITKNNGLPPMTGEETESELSLHAQVVRLEAMIKAKQDELNSLSDKLNNANATIEYLEGYNERLISRLNKQDIEQVKKAIV